MSNEEVYAPELATASVPIQPEETLLAQAERAGPKDAAKLQAEVLALQHQVKQQRDEIRELEAQRDGHTSEIAMLARELREALQRVDHQDMVHTNLQEEQESEMLRLKDRMSALRTGTYRVITKKDERIAELEEALVRQQQFTREMAIDLEERIAKLEESWRP